MVALICETLQKGGVFPVKVGEPLNPNSCCSKLRIESDLFKVSESGIFRDSESGIFKGKEIESDPFMVKKIMNGIID